MSKQEITTELQGESLLPKENTFVRRTFPRISFTSQDQKEGKGKNTVITEEAGTFFTERPTDETDDKNKKIWNHEEIGKSMEGVIFFTRKKLSYYDQPNNTYYTSSYYDQDTDIVPLWCKGKKIAEGTKEELQKPYRRIEDDPKDPTKKKTVNKLAENKVLYIWYKNEVFELTVAGTSMWEYSKYYKEWNTEPNKNMTELSYEDCENGSIVWSKILFKRMRQLTQDEWDTTRNLAAEMLQGIAEEKAYFAGMNTDVPQATLAAEDWSPDVKVAALGDGKEF